jgi:eukaryotic-like serine/threonine-protein kinase
MKRCPECRRDYFDDTLRFCLDDGAELLEGPSSFDSPTISMSAPDSERGGGETATKLFRTDPDAQAKRPGGVPAAVFAVIGVVLAGLGYGVYKFANRSEPAVRRPAAALDVQRLTNDGKTRGAIISPDGKFLAYIRTEGGEQSIWLKQVATTSAIQVAKPGELTGFDGLNFSPDGDHLFFNAQPNSNEPPSVFKVSTLGGTPIKVISGAVGLEFSPDGKRLSFMRFDINRNESSIFVANEDGSGERQIATRSGKQFFKAEHTWSPDGKYIAAIGGDDGLVPEPIIAILLLPVDGGEYREAFERRWDEIDDIVWHSSGDSLYMVAREQAIPIMQVWEIAYPSGESRKLTNNLNGHYSISITRDGNSIVTGELYSRAALWVSNDLKPENARQVMPASSDTWGFGWTPDGKIVFSSDRSGDPEIWMIDADGQNAKQLTTDRAFKTVPVASADGKFIVFNSTADGGRIDRIDNNGGNRIVIARESGADNADISPDSQWVIFSSWASGSGRVKRVPASGGPAELLTDYAAIEPRYSRDGTRFACFVINERTGDFGKLAIVPAGGGPPEKVFDIPPTVNTGRGPIWTPDDKGITMVLAEGEKQNLWLQPVDGSPGQRITDFEVPGIARREYSRDGKRIAIMRAEGIGNAIMITGFR